MAGDAIDAIVSQERNIDATASSIPLADPDDDGDDDDAELRIQLAISLCLLVGLIQVSYRGLNLKGIL